MSKDYKVIVSFSLGMLTKIKENIVKPKKVDSLINQAQWILDNGVFDVSGDPEHYLEAKEFLHELVRYLGGVESVCESLHKRKYNLKDNWRQSKKGKGSLRTLSNQKRNRSMGRTFTQFVQLYYSDFTNMKKQHSNQVHKTHGKAPSFRPPYFNSKMGFGGNRRKSRRKSRNKSCRRKSRKHSRKRKSRSLKKSRKHSRKRKSRSLKKSRRRISRKRSRKRKCNC